MESGSSSGSGSSDSDSSSSSDDSSDSEGEGSEAGSQTEGKEKKVSALCERLYILNSLFTLPDSNSDSKPSGYIGLYRSFHTAQSQIQIPILTANYKNGIGIPSP